MLRIVAIDPRPRYNPDMLYEALDALFIAVDDLSAASGVHERLGLRLGPEQDLYPGLRARSFAVGQEANRGAIRLLADRNGTTSNHFLHEQVRQARAASRHLLAAALRVPNLAGVIEQLTAQKLDESIVQHELARLHDQLSSARLGPSH
jgi:hypothetical protein